MAIASGDATLPQQEKIDRQMSRRTKYAAMYLHIIDDFAVLAGAFSRIS
jgi:hypothetical protein